MTKTDNASLVGVHKFEAAGLGKAPFRFMGTSENVVTVGVGADAYTKAGGSCDYCGSGIRTEFHLKSADGKTFKVGCNCIEKAGDEGVLKAYKQSPEYRQKMREARSKKAAAVQVELMALIEAKRAQFATMPHPHGFTDRKTGAALTFMDQVQWMLDHCGAAGRASLLKGLKKQIAVN